jgi:Spy/CpxP family protein refolding chaperone
MKLTKTLAIAALMAGGLFAGSALQAQDNTNTPPAGARPGGPGMRARPNIEQITKDLGLSDDQKAKVKTLMEDQAKKVQELRADTSLSQEDRRAKMKEIRDDMVSKMKEILTADQFEKWQKMMPRRPQGGPGGAPGGADKPAAGGDNAPKN